MIFQQNQKFRSPQVSSNSHIFHNHGDSLELENATMLPHDLKRKAPVASIPRHRSTKNSMSIIRSAPTILPRIISNLGALTSTLTPLIRTSRYQMQWNHILRFNAGNFRSPAPSEAQKTIPQILTRISQIDGHPLLMRLLISWANLMGSSFFCEGYKDDRNSTSQARGAAPLYPHSKPSCRWADAALGPPHPFMYIWIPIHSIMTVTNRQALQVIDHKCAWSIMSINDPSELHI